MTVLPFDHRPNTPGASTLGRQSSAMPSRLSWVDWTKVIGPAMLICRDTARERMGRIGRRYEDHMAQLLIYYGLGEISPQNRAALTQVMDHLEEVEAWRAKQLFPDNLNNPETVWRVLGSQRARLRRTAGIVEHAAVQVGADSGQGHSCSPSGKQSLVATVGLGAG
jgi:hypothetical protein